jgi:hypothetical protein
MLALCETFLGTGRSNRLVGNLGVSGRINGGLRYEHYVTNRAMLTLGETCRGAGRSNRTVDSLGVLTGGKKSLGLLFTAFTISCHLAIFSAGGLFYSNPLAILMGVRGLLFVIVGISSTLTAASGKAKRQRKHQRKE